MTTDTFGERKASFEAAMAAKAAPTPEAPPKPPAEAAPAAPNTANGTSPVVPPSTPEPGSTGEVGEAGATKAASRWKRKVKALDEVREVDLEAMSEDELDTLLGRGLAHETIKERLRAARDEALERLEASEQKSRNATNEWWTAQLKAEGYTYKYDNATRKLTLVPPQTQTASNGHAASGQAIDWDALEKKALEEGTAEALIEYGRTIRRTLADKPALTTADVDRLVGQRLQEAERKLSHEKERSEAARDFDRRFRSAFDARKAAFAKFGDPEEAFKAIQRDAYARSCVPGATEDLVFGAITERAEAMEKAWQAAQAGTQTPMKPRPKAPTVIPSGGAPAPGPTDPKAFDRSTPEGRKKAAAHLQSQMDARRGAASVA